jgi:hypothetical protein
MPLEVEVLAADGRRLDAVARDPGGAIRREALD